jgi:predicted HicB family RNase H-like nuclease
MIEYLGYVGSVVFDDEAGLFHGEVVNTRDVITFQGETVAEIRQAFHDSIDDYLDFCAERNEQPEKPMSGKFNVRISPLLHAHAVAVARSRDISLNTLVERAMEEFIGTQFKSAAVETIHETRGNRVVIAEEHVYVSPGKTEILPFDFKSDGLEQVSPVAYIRSRAA